MAHFHYVLSLSMTMLCFGGIYYWFPKMTGRMFNEKLGKLSFWLILIGAMVAFWPHFVMGYDGVPRRYWTYPAEYTGIMKISSIFAFIAILGFFISMYNLVSSAIKGEKAPQNPWNAKSLEWQIPSPPPFYNFERIPVIESGPYEFGVKKKE
jgi:cytochrome c oxidase subunit 1